MFCPNCGNEYTDEKICPNCGCDVNTRFAAAKGNDSWVSGQTYCPKCQSVSIAIGDNNRGYGYYIPIKTVLSLLVRIWGTMRELAHHKKNGTHCVCLNCGHEWYVKQTERTKKYQEILHRHLGTCENLSIRACKDTWLGMDSSNIAFHFSQTDVRVFPYDEIIAVAYQKNLGPLHGWLSIRDRAHKYKVFPKTYMEAEKDKLTIFYEYDGENCLYKVFSALAEIAEQNKKEGLF